MNFEATGQLLAVVGQYLDLQKTHISLENRDRRGRPYRSDLVTIDESNHIGFEVFENEITCFYFTDHCHFWEYADMPAEGEDHYVAQAIQFLNRLFTLPIKYAYTKRGKKTVREEYFFLLPDGTEESIEGVFLTPSLKLFSPKRDYMEIFRFHADIQTFQKE